MSEPDPLHKLIRGLAECRRWSHLIQEQLDALSPQLSDAPPSLTNDLQQLVADLRRLEADFTLSLEKLEESTDLARWLARHDRKGS